MEMAITILSELTIDGEWWVAGNEGLKAAGRLHFDSQGMELRLNQAFSPPVGAIRPGDPNPRYPAVHGVTVKGEAVTLFDAQQIGSSFNFGSGGIAQPGKIFARVIVFGAHLPPGFVFKTVQFRVPGLQVWLGRPAIAHEIFFSEREKLQQQRFGLGVIPEESCRIQSVQASLSWFYGLNQTLNPFTSLSVVVDGRFALTPDEPASFDWFLRQSNALLNLLTLLSGHPLVPDAIHGKCDGLQFGVDFLVVAPRPKNLSGKQQPRDFLLSRTAIGTPLVECINRWFELAERVEKPVSLAQSVLSSEDLWLHMEFLSLMQALEGLHRALFDGNYMPDEAYGAVKSVLIGAIPATVARDHRDSLSSRIQYGNQISLKKRLDELVNSLPEGLRVRVLGERGVVPRSWIDTRNYYTHWDSELLPNVLGAQSMYFANVRMKVLLRVLYARLVGVEAGDLQQALEGVSDIAQELIHANIVERRRADPYFVPQALMTVSSHPPEEDGGGESEQGDEEGSGPAE